MADEPTEVTGSIPEALSDDAPTDIDFNAMLARSQAQLIMQTGREYQANVDLKEKVAIIKELRGTA